MSRPSLGEFTDTGASATISVDRLVESRMLLQAGSGGGKSWALRRVLEQTAGKVQQIVIDPDGEFATLREKFDYVIAAAHDGDALAHPRTAALLARRLLETGVSAIIDIYDLKKHERLAFVRILCETIVDAPKDLWHPALIVLDEAHVFVPEAEKAECAGAVIDLASRGRKRGYSLLAATQRIAKLSKDCAAELHNKLIGLTTLDVDVKRAAFELGLPPAEAMRELRALEPGEFFGFGPALWPTVRKLKTGPVQTTHPKAGKRSLRAPPKPTEAIKAVLPKLADLPKEAETEARTIEELKRELASARRELTAAAKQRPPAPTPEKVGAAELRTARATIKRLREAVEALMKIVVRINAIEFGKEARVDPQALQKAIDSAVAQAMRLIDQKLGDRAKALEALQRDGGRIVASIQRLLSEKIELNLEVKHQEPFAVTAGAKPLARSTPAPRENGFPGMTAPQQKLLDRLAWLEQHGLYPAPKETLAAVAGVSPTSGGYFNNLGALRSAGYIDYPSPGEVGFTDTGRSLADPGNDQRPVHEHWLDVVTGPQATILQALIGEHPKSIEKDELARMINVSPTSGGYFNNLGRLRTLGAIDYPQRGHVALTRHVMPDDPR
ncbi:MAG: helicase HerA domain-containing protein [Steroidobacteraceae bacterium]